MILELTNDTIVRYVDAQDTRDIPPTPQQQQHSGHLDSADEWGNLQLSNATVQPLQRSTTSLPYTYIRARYVRFIHLPPTLDPAASVKAYRRRTLLSARSAARAATDAPRGKQGVLPPSQKHSD